MQKKSEGTCIYAKKVVILQRKIIKEGKQIGRIEPLK